MKNTDAGNLLRHAACLALAILLAAGGMGLANGEETNDAEPTPLPIGETSQPEAGGPETGGTGEDQIPLPNSDESENGAPSETGSAPVGSDEDASGQIDDETGEGEAAPRQGGGSEAGTGDVDADPAWRELTVEIDGAVEGNRIWLVEAAGEALLF